MSIHTGINLYKCAYCSKTCRQSNNMYTHQKRCRLKQLAQSSEAKIEDKTTIA